MYSDLVGSHDKGLRSVAASTRLALELAHQLARLLLNLNPDLGALYQRVAQNSVAGRLARLVVWLNAVSR